MDPPPLGVKALKQTRRCFVVFSLTLLNAREALGLRRWRGGYRRRRVLVILLIVVLRYCCCRRRCCCQLAVVHDGRRRDGRGSLSLGHRVYWWQTFFGETKQEAGRSTIKMYSRSSWHDINPWRATWGRDPVVLLPG